MYAFNAKREKTRTVLPMSLVFFAHFFQRSFYLRGRCPCFLPTTEDLSRGKAKKQGIGSHANLSCKLPFVTRVRKAE